MIDYIGRIISRSKNIETIDFVDITNSYDSIDYNVPTLIVGKEFAEEIFGKEKIKVLDKKIDNNIFWCFGKFERRDEYESSLNEFNNYIISELLNSVDYTFFSIFNHNLTDKKNLISFLKNESKKIIYILDDHIYINFDKKVLGLSLKEFEYVGLDRNKILRMIYGNKSNYIIENDCFLSKKFKSLIGDNNIVIPYLFKFCKNLDKLF